MHRRTLLELAVQDVAGVRVAAAVRAARVELCVALGATGGLTPSIGLIEMAVETAAAEAASRTAHDAAGLLVRPPPVEVHPLIRPRAGGFVYDDADLAVQVCDVRAAVSAGAAGVVVGALTAAGEVDTRAVATLVAAAGGHPVTFHRAIDTLADPLGALDTLAELGVTRVLTSGGAARSIDGVECLHAMVDRARGRLEVMAGGGVRPDDIAALVEAGVDAIHLSAKGFVVDAAGVGGGSEVGYEVTDATSAHKALEALSAAGSCG